MNYEKYTFWLLLVFAVSVSTAAYWVHKKVSEVESTLTEKLKEVEMMTELVTVNLPNIKSAAATLESTKKALTDAGFADPSSIIDWVAKTFGPTPVLQSPQPKITKTSATPMTYKIGR